jgi:glutamine amidotransferase
MVGIIDYGMGNLFSVANACKYVGIDAELVQINSDLENYDAIILPGVGAFGDAMKNLNKYNMSDQLIDFARTGKYILGICLGMQLLVSKSFDLGENEGLGLIDGVCKSFKSLSESIITPQIMWNNLLVNYENPNLILDGIKKNQMVYFVHSFFVETSDKSLILANTIYEDVEYCSVFQKSNVIGIQFHPEKSGKIGLRIYNNFKNMIY